MRERFSTSSSVHRNRQRDPLERLSSPSTFETPQETRREIPDFGTPSDTPREVTEDRLFDTNPGKQLSCSATEINTGAEKMNNI